MLNKVGSPTTPKLNLDCLLNLLVMLVVFIFVHYLLTVPNLQKTEETTYSETVLSNMKLDVYYWKRRTSVLIISSEAGCLESYQHSSAWRPSCDKNSHAVHST